jgi:hypothetical protein
MVLLKKERLKSKRADQESGSRQKAVSGSFFRKYAGCYGGMLFDSDPQAEWMPEKPAAYMHRAPKGS